MSSRRSFLRRSLLASGALLAPPLLSHADAFSPVRTLTILHTNDTHSRIDPFPMDGSRNAGMGGVAARAALINRIRREGGEVLLLDAGDIFQGTPYFNLYKGEPELRSMSAMGYDAATVGNHDFDAGLENLATQLRRHANFPMIVANYDFSRTPMEGLYAPRTVLRKGGLKIGITGVGIELRGLVPESLYGNTVYTDPVRAANEQAAELRRKGCDLVICLSHLGHKYSGNTVSDQVLARETENIDLIIGGHTHTFLDAPQQLTNRAGRPVLVNQVGFAGIQLGRIDYQFTPSRGAEATGSAPLPVSKKVEE